MNIENSKINYTKTTSTNTTNSNNTKNENSSVKFSDELKDCEKAENKNSKAEENIDVQETESTKNITTPEIKTNENTDLNKNNIEIDETTIVDIKKDNKFENAIKGLNSIVEELNQTDEKNTSEIKKNNILADNEFVINKDMNIQDKKDILPQLNPNMNFSGDGQPFSSFMNEQAEKHFADKQRVIAGTSAQDLKEEAAILSTMAENIALANKNQLIKEATVANNEGIEKIDTQTGIKIETIVKYDSIIMNQADVELFANIVENKEIDLNNLDTKSIEKSVQVSKTLADMLAKAMEKNQPVRIDFDNNISIIIKISRDGKITADFLPSSQVAEAYLKENLPLLRQRFDENNIKYDELNQRERRESNKEQNRKKERNNE